MIDESILNVSDDDLIEILLSGNGKFSLERNSSIIKALTDYIENSEKFDKLLFQTNIYFLRYRFCAVHVLIFLHYFSNVLFFPF